MKSKKSKTPSGSDPRFNVAALGLDPEAKAATPQVPGWDQDDDSGESPHGSASESEDGADDYKERVVDGAGSSSESEEDDDTGSDGENSNVDEDGDNDDDADDDSAALASPPPMHATKKVITATDVQKFKEKRDRTGLVYLSRVPPFMPPEVVRKLLSQYATLGRMYLAPEDPKSSARRKKYKKNGRKMYTEGWVEVLDKREAKAMASNLNNQLVGGKKLSKWHDCIWNIKYLPKFKWHHLTEQISYERRQREQRLRAEIMQAKRENKVYLENVAKSKMISAMKDKNKQKRKRAEADADADMEAVPTGDKAVAAAASATNAVSELDGIRRRFKQRKVVHDVEEVEDRDEDLSKVKGVLSKIFG